MRMTGLPRAVRLTAALVAVGLAAVATGCGPGGPATRTATGKVTFDGQPIPEGRITFRPSGGSGASYSAPIAAGAYKLQCEPGAYAVEITASRIIPGKFDTSNPGTKEPVGEMYIPKSYNAETTLKAEVGSGPNEFNFDLQPDKK